MNYEWKVPKVSRTEFYLDIVDQTYLFAARRDTEKDPRTPVVPNYPCEFQSSVLWTQDQGLDRDCPTHRKYKGRETETEDMNIVIVAYECTRYYMIYR